MGGIANRPDGQVAWTGGRPALLWVGLVDTNPDIESDMYRPASLKSEGFARKKRTSAIEGVSLKTGAKPNEEGGDLLFFQEKLAEHLVKTGLDTIAYLPSPIDGTRMVNIVTNHSSFTVESATSAVVPQVLLYDSYDKGNNKEANLLLLACIHPSLERDVRRRIPEALTVPFPVLFMAVLREVTSIDHSRFKRIIKTIETASPDQVGELKISRRNLLDVNAALRPLFEDLDLGNALNFELLTKPIDIAFAAAGPGTHPYLLLFRGKLVALYEKVNKAIEDVRMLNATDSKRRELQTQNAWYTDIFRELDAAYRAVNERSVWPAASNPIDSRAPPAQAHANVLQENMGRGGGRRGPSASSPCSRCGGTDHWVRECPQTAPSARPAASGAGRGAGRGPRNSNASRGSPSRGSQGRNTGANPSAQPQRGSSTNYSTPTAAPRPASSNTDGDTSARTTPPRPGEPTSKTINGKEAHWCAKCGRQGKWVYSHGTADHRGPGNDVHREGPNANLGLVEDPCAWHVQPLTSLWSLFLPYILAAAAGFIAAVCMCDGIGLVVRWLVARPWSMIAPTTWLIALVAMLYLLLWPPDPLPKYSRRQRRWMNQNSHRRGRPRFGSIRDYGLNRHYPRRLRSQNLFIGRAPTVRKREVQAILSDLRHQVQVLVRAHYQGLHDSARPPCHGSAAHRRAACARPWQVRDRLWCSRCGVNGKWTYSHTTDTHRGPSNNRPFSLNARPARAPAPRRFGTRANVARYEPQGPNFNPTETQVFVAQTILRGPVLRRSVLGQAALTFRQVLGSGSTFPVIWDSGASISISHDRNDFVGHLEALPILRRLQGLASGMRIHGQGEVEWMLHDETTGLVTRAIRIPAYYVPAAKTRLLSVVSLTQTYEPEQVHISPRGAILSGLDSDLDRDSVFAPVNPRNNLPTSTASNRTRPLSEGETRRCSRDADSPDPSIDDDLPECASAHVIEDTNSNLSNPEKELLRWHFRLGHIDMRKVQFLMRSGVLSHTQQTKSLHTAACSIRTPPKCAACQFAKQTRRSVASQASTPVRDVKGLTKQDATLPGQRIFVDHFVCAKNSKGRTFSSFGKEADSDMYSGGCVFYDAASKYIDVRFQRQFNTHETLESKGLFEAFAREQGVIPQEYVSDGGRCFTSQDFGQHLGEFKQVLAFAAPGAHHHNPAERAIRTVTSIARAMMIHSAIHWPEMSDTCLWPMAVQHAAYLYNHVPDTSTGLSPLDLFSRSRWEQSKLLGLHVWGCPTYLLEHATRDGKKIPRWVPRSERCSNMGLSSSHVSLVPMVLNPRTGSISAQFHVVWDDWFATVSSDPSSLPDFGSAPWTKLFGDHPYDYNLDDDVPPSSAPTPLSEWREQTIGNAFDANLPPVPLVPSPTPAPESLFDAPTTTPPALESMRTPETADLQPSPLQRESTIEPAVTPPPVVQLIQPTSADATPTSQAIIVRPASSVVRPTPSTRPTRIRQAPKRLDLSDPSTFVVGYCSQLKHQPYQYDPTLDHPLAFKAKSANADPDLFTYDRAMSDPTDKDKWVEAAIKEIRGLEAMGTWIEVLKSDAKKSIVPMTWVFRVKRTPDGLISKYKARSCVMGNLMDDYEQETYAPVVAWSTVRIFMVLATLFDWYTCSIDFAQAFLHAYLDEPLWVQLPRGFRSALGRHACLELKRSCYGTSFAPKLWFDLLLSALLEDGFTQSQFDPCFLFKREMLLVLYVDDTGIAAKHEADVTALIQRLKDKGFELTRDPDFSSFLGIRINMKPHHVFEMTQQGLIEKILQATNMEECNPNWVPAQSSTLGADPEGEPFDEEWEYSSVVGMLIYLSTNTRPDITFAVSQVARFNHTPKKSHGTAVKTIIRYLAGTKDKGTIVNMTNKLELDTYVDADFAGLYQREPDQSPISAKSRLGFIIFLAGCPLVWKSQLQTEIALSTAESEYSSLSIALKTTIPIINLLKEITAFLNMPDTISPTVHSRVFEDNNAALQLANEQRLTNRTRYYHTKWHWFWHHVNEGTIKILRIETTLQRADTFTKGLVREVFERIRKLNQGW